MIPRTCRICLVISEISSWKETRWGPALSISEDQNAAQKEILSEKGYRSSKAVQRSELELFAYTFQDLLMDCGKWSS